MGRLKRDLGRDSGYRSGLLIISSPMRRCLLTIRPAVKYLADALPPECCLCHGACFEYGCAGTEHAGSSTAEIAKEFPEFLPVGFNLEGRWDYKGASPKENEEECRIRGARIVQWLLSSGTAALRTAVPPSCTPSRRQHPTMILAAHQTIADLVCHLLLRGTTDG